MKNILIKKILSGDYSEKIISVHGWVKSRRDSKSGISFISINDGSCFDNLQLVAPNTLENYNYDVLKLTSGSSIKATGKIVISQGKNQAYEMQINEIKVIGWIENPDTYPIQPKRHTLEYLREVAHLRPRTNTIGAIARIRHSTSQAIHNFLSSNDFLWIHTPIITSNDCEGAGELFRVSTLDLMNLPFKGNQQIDFSKDFFGRESFLTVSGQLNLETYCQALSRVYTFGPTFRAENSNTSRHLAEFWMIEPEIAFAELDDVIDLAIKLLKYTIEKIQNERSDDFTFLEKHVDKEIMKRAELIVNSDFARMTYGDAIQYIQKSKQKFEFPVKWGLALQSEHEKYICEKITKVPTVITDYPKDIKSFYMRLNDDNKTVAAMDIITPGIGEIIGGSQREERLDFLEQRINELGLNKNELSWYIDLRKYGTVPHGGFGLGLERLIGYITGIKNVRDLIPFPRTPGHANY